MVKRIRLFLITCSIAALLFFDMYFQTANNDNDLNTLKELFFITLLFNPVFMSINDLLSLCSTIINIHSGTYNTDHKPSKKSDFDHNVSLTFYVQLIIFIILTVFKYENLYNYIQKFNLTCITGMLISSILVKVIELSGQDKESIYDISLMQGLDYGSGLAYSYFYGYLKLILPATGSVNKGLIEKLEDAEDIHNINIAVHKLLILIPESAYIPSDLKEASYQWMESAIQLEGEVRDRAGVKKRVYHNIIYKIYPDGKRTNCTPVYVAVEGATPLLTFFEVLKHAHSETNVYRKYRKEIVNTFYMKLKELINDDPQCMDICDLIYYNDYDSNGTKVNVAKVILDRLHKNNDNKLNINL